MAAKRKRGKDLAAENRQTMPLWPEAGQYLGIGRSATYQAAERGEIPILSFGRRKVAVTAVLKKMVGLV